MDTETEPSAFCNGWLPAPILNAMGIVEEYGMTDGAHHKQWVMDQMIRALLGVDEYARWVAIYNQDAAIHDYRAWDTSTAP